MTVKEIAKDPIHEENRKRWCKHNSLHSNEPIVLIFPEGSWKELIPPDTLQSENPALKQLELELLKRIYSARQLRDDNPVSDEITVNKMLVPFDWGNENLETRTSESTGSDHLETALNDLSDLKKLRHPEVNYLEKETHNLLSLYEDVAGDLLPVRLKGIQRLDIHMANQYNRLRGVDNFMRTSI